MLFVLNIVIILFVLGMAALWATYGFFSGFIQLVVVIIAGVIALAVWEPIAFWLLGRMPAYAHGVGLLAPFALLLIILRAVLDRLCRMNVHLPRLADQIGGGVCGVAAGVLAFGMLLNGANFLPIERGAMGWEPYNIQGNDVVPNEEGRLWSFTRVNEYSGAFFEFLAGGSMSPMSGPTLVEARPNLAERAAVYRVPVDPNQMKSAHPDSVKVAGVYAVPATIENVRALVERSVIVSFLDPGYKTPENPVFGESGLGLVNAIKKDLQARYDNPAENGQVGAMLNVDLMKQVNEALELGFDAPSAEDEFESFLALATDKIAQRLLYTDAGEPNAFAKQLGEGKSLFIVDTLWNSKTPGAYGSDSKLRVAISQIRLQVRRGGELEMVPPIGYSIEYSPNTRGRTFTELATEQQYIAYSPYNEFHLGWAFLLPTGQEPVRFFARELRFDLTELKTPQGQDSPVNQNPGAVARVLGAPLLPTAKAEGEGDDQTVATGSVRIGNTDAYAVISEATPRSFGGATATGLVVDEAPGNWTLREGSTDRLPAGRGGLKSTVRSIWVPADSRLVMIKLDSKKANSIYGRARGLAESLNQMSVKDAGGNSYPGIGYILLRADKTMQIDIRDDAEQGGLHASELPNVGQGESMFVYFQVPVGQSITTYALGPNDALFEEPLEVKAK